MDEKRKELCFVRRAVAVSLLIAALATAAAAFFLTHRAELLAGRAENCAWKGDLSGMEAALSSLESLAEQDPEKTEPYHAAVLTCADILNYRGQAEDSAALLENAQELDTACAEKAESLLQESRYIRALASYEAGNYAEASRLAFEDRDYEPARVLYALAEAALSTPVPTPEPTEKPVSAPTAAPSAVPPLNFTLNLNFSFGEKDGSAAEPSAAEKPSPKPTAVPTPEPTESPVPTAAATPEPTEVPVPTPRPAGMMSAGFSHTVVLRDDGTVFAAGEGTQTDVSGWTDVIAVAAGARHTLGLRKDGTVLACGDNTSGQCDVTMFSGVTAIAAGYDDSCCLLTDGRVMSAGYGCGAFLSGLSGIRRIFAGAYGTVAMTEEGMRFSHPSLLLDVEDITDLAIAPGVAICADAAGNTHCTYDRVPQWTDIIRVAAGENGVIALGKDGKIKGFLFGRHGKCSFDFEQPVIDIAAGPNHFAFLLADGTLEIRGIDGSTERYEIK